ncbi:YcaO-like family protein [Actinomadura alba]|uniref:YcaO-like family protein n=1 Tax=Actinomadura alba TaxID=406431 RepID=A0ABR7LSR8_9ACTN|nr:YcaO-like family protein [Actinomadura alba]MBC6467887.1 YcaO-like family protein [Actinomadura alba]
MTTEIREVVRPRMRTDMAFLETRDGVYVHGHGDSFVIRGAGAYRYLSALLPHLDGSTTLHDLVAPLPEAHAVSVRSLIATLASRGVITDAPERSAVLDSGISTRFAGQIALLEHHGDDGTGFLRAARARVLVICEDPAQAAALADSLTANGVGCAPAGSVRVATAGEVTTASLTGVDLLCLIAVDRPSPALFELAAGARGAGAAFVSLVRVGDRLILGPWQHRDGRGACLHSMMLRLSDNGIAGAADVWRTAVAGTAAAAPATALPGTAVSVAVSVAGFEVFKALTGAISSDIDGAVVIMDPDRLTIQTERVVQHPAAPHGSRTDAAIAEPDGADLSTVERAYLRFEHVVADTVGIIRRFDDDAISQIPAKVSALIAPSADPAPIVAFGSDVLLGARLAALEEASLRYAVNIHRRCEGLLAPAGPDAEVVEAERLPTWLGAVPPAGDTLVAASDLAGSAPLALPRGAVLAGPWDRRAARFEPDLAGLAAGSTPEAAASRALLGAAGAYTCTAVAHEEIPVRPVGDPSNVAGADPEQRKRLSMLMEALRRDGRSLTFYLALGVVPVAIVRVREGSGEHVTARAGHSWFAAVESALLAIAGAHQIAESPTGWTGPCAPAAPTLAGFAVSERLKDTSVLNETVEHDTVLARLHAAGMRAGKVDLTPPDLSGVTNVVRVLLFRAAGRSG